MREFVFQYQALTEPIRELVTVDQWYFRSQNPIVKKDIRYLYTNVSHTQSDFVPTVDGWQFNQPVQVPKNRISHLLPPTVDNFPEEGEEISVDSWNFVSPQPQRKQQYQYLIPSGGDIAAEEGEEVSVDSWFVNQQNPIYARYSLAPYISQGGLIQVSGTGIICPDIAVEIGPVMVLSSGPTMEVC